MWYETIRQFVNAVCKMMFENNQQLNFTEITEKCLTLPPLKSFGAKTKALSLQPLVKSLKVTKLEPCNFLFIFEYCFPDHRSPGRNPLSGLTGKGCEVPP